ncbi:MAG: hypothetical protein J1F01_03195 [Oscillospiraceae bacterium]|nr:hypothetical protein [Oscillospiraceae bacterium]
MSITKMKAVTIAGQINEFDNVVEKYVYGRDIHLENAMSVITNSGRITGFDDNNEYDDIAKSAKSILELAKYDVNPKLLTDENMNPEDMKSFIEGISRNIEHERKQDTKLTERIEANNAAISKMELMMNVEVDLSKLFRMEFIHCKFGRIPKTGYKTLVTYLNDIEAFFVKTAEDVTDIWGFYFSPVSKESKVEEVFNSLYFETVEISDDFTGTPYEIKQRLLMENKKLQEEIKENSEKTSKMLSTVTDKLCGIYNLAKKRHQFSEIRRNAVHGDMFFYVVGWMEAKDALKLEKEINASGDVVMFYIEDAKNVKNMQPPTKLKNNPLFKPFEMFVKMYGLPSYNEIDPTPILAITYILFFGIMFGDVGQSLVLAIAGFVVYKVKKMDLGGIIGMVGIAGIISGFIYGSFFGNEEIIPELFGINTLKPMENIMPLLIGTVCMGGVIIIMGIALNIVNMIKARNLGEALFGHNGLAGALFYITVVLFAVNMLGGLGIPGAVFGIMLGVSLLTMYLNEPLTRLIEGKKNLFPSGAMFFVESFFELFEVILSFCTNTISFLRIGAFAVIHVGMMMAVASLSSGGGVGGAVVTVIGNAIVMVLEGLIVAIQVLRLEYYEMFSRYFVGRGKEFISLKDK